MEHLEDVSVDLLQRIQFLHEQNGKLLKEIAASDTQAAKNNLVAELENANNTCQRLWETLKRSEATYTVRLHQEIEEVQKLERQLKILTTSSHVLVEELSEHLLKNTNGLPEPRDLQATKPKVQANFLLVPQEAKCPFEHWSGAWSKDGKSPDGFGVARTAEGHLIEGRWKHDSAEFHGKYRVIYYDGTIFIGTITRKQAKCMFINTGIISTKYGWFRIFGGQNVSKATQKDFEEATKEFEPTRYSK